MKKFLILGGLIVLGGLAVNYMLGGFKKIKSEQVSINSMAVYGKHYEGRFASDSLDNIIELLQAQIETPDTSGSLVIVNYLQEDLEKRGIVKQFVGIIHNRPPDFNIQLDTLMLPASKAIQFNIPINPLVMPSPEKLKRMANNGAEQQNLTLAGYSIEQYKGKLLVVTFPVK